MFKNRKPDNNPTVITRGKVSAAGETSYGSATREGLHFRVIPHTQREVFYLASLEVGHNVFAPKDGDGVIIAASALPL
tara:strand:+ start:4479 stop:4712 length:234 start_codon:yes stop_codon:yes gene_type:complete